MPLLSNEFIQCYKCEWYYHKDKTHTCHTSKPVPDNTMSTCNSCKGSGKYVGLLVTEDCRECGGSGKAASPGSTLVLDAVKRYDSVGSTPRVGQRVVVGGTTLGTIEKIDKGPGYTHFWVNGSAYSYDAAKGDSCWEFLD